MLLRNEHIDDLADLLDSGADRPLTDSERAILRAAIIHLAGAEALIAQQSALLASYGHDLRAIAAATSSAFDRLRTLVDSHSPGVAYDFSAAHTARQDLIRSIDDSAKGRQILDAVLRFVALTATAAI